jgi:tripartite-type tricarboxylate transporter receptor subunit TctC
MKLLARPALICGLVIAAFAATPNASAVDYPVRPIKLVVPYAAGGPTDVLGRLVADYLGRDLKQTVIVENKPGAQGAIGAEAVARADPDGYTLFVAAGSIIVLNPMLYKKLSYDPVKDFRMLALVTDLPVVMEVHPSVPAGFPVFRPRSAAAITEFIDADRARWSAVIRAQNISLD